MDHAPASVVGLFAMPSWGGHEGAIMSDGPDSGAVERSASPASTQRLSIFQLESELAELIEFRDNEELTAEERTVVDGQIAEYIKREISKVDALRSYMRHCGMMEAAAKEESELQANRARSWRSRLDYLKGCCLGAMQIMGKKRLEGRTGYLLAKANGGLEALTVYDEKLLPSAYKTLTFQVNLSEWERFAAECNQMAHSMQVALSGLMTSAGFVSTIEPDNKAIRAAMSKPCVKCDGVGALGPAEGEVATADTWGCGDCGGLGKQSVPGARLEPRGSHVEIK